jgi:hypothetical protein
LDAWKPDDDLVINLFHPFEEDLSPYTHDDFQPFLKSYDEYPFDSNFFYEDFQPPS